MIREEHMTPRADPRVDTPLRHTVVPQRKWQLAAFLAIILWGWHAPLLAQSPLSPGDAKAIDQGPRQSDAEIQWWRLSEVQDAGASTPVESSKLEPNPANTAFSSAADGELEDLKMRLEVLEKELSSEKIRQAVGQG